MKRPAVRPLLLVALAFLGALPALQPAAAGSAPELVSPGLLEEASGVSTSCPTFTWGLKPELAATAERLDLRVYRIDDSAGGEPEEVLSQRLPASARAWTPPTDRCLEIGATYAWTVGVGESGDTRLAWSDTSLFRVVSAADPLEFDSELEALRRGLAPAAALTGLEIAAGDGAAAANGPSSGPDPIPSSSGIATGDAALVAELAGTAGVTYGLKGLSHSLDGYGIAGLNTNGGVGVAASGGIDLLLDGAPSAALTEAGFSRGSASDLVFDFSNPDVGALTLQVDGTDVLTAHTGAAKSHTHSGSDVNDGTLPPGKLDPTGASAGDAVMFDGANPIWGKPVASELGLPYAGSVTTAGPAVSISNTGAAGFSGSALAVEASGGTGLVVGNSAFGIDVEDASLIGIRVKNTSTGVRVEGSATGLSVPDANIGVSVLSATKGLDIGTAQTGVAMSDATTGIRINRAGNPAKTTAPSSSIASGLGVGIDGAAVMGAWIGYAGAVGINIEEVGALGGTSSIGLRVGISPGLGIAVDDAQAGMKVTSATTDGFIAGATGGSGFKAEAASGAGLEVVSAGTHGVLVDSAVADGLRVDNAGDDGLEVTSFAGHGVHVAGAGNHGLFVGNADRDGLHIAGFADAYPSGVGIFVSKGDVGAKVAHFDGVVEVVGNLIKPAGTFRIDHPVDPENRYLSHSFVESPDMMNVYNGNVVLDRDGRAVVRMPDWFEALNREFRYQLTAIGGPGPGLHVAREVEDDSFEIAGGDPGLKVSWQLTGVRRDAYAEAHRTPIESWKAPEERGYYLHPAAFGLPPERGISHARMASRTGDAEVSGAQGE